MLQRHLLRIVPVQVLPDLLDEPAIRRLRAALGQAVQQRFQPALPVLHREQPFGVITALQADLCLRPPALQNVQHLRLLMQQNALCEQRQPGQMSGPLLRHPLHPLQIAGQDGDSELIQPSLQAVVVCRSTPFPALPEGMNAPVPLQ
ncbi:hypothetical protein ACFSQ7_07145 [Paenibacillus rhizoplanae]